MTNARNSDGWRVLLRHPWITASALFYIGGLITLAILRQTEALYAVLSTLLLAGVGLGLTAWLTRGKSSRPGPAPRAWIGLLLGVGLTVCAILRPNFICPIAPEEPLCELLGQLGLLLLLPLAVLLLSGVPWSYLGLPSLVRGMGRWRKLGLLLTAALTLPALLRPGVWSTLQQGPADRLLLALTAAYSYALLARALPLEFLYRQVYQPRLQSLLQQTPGAIVGQTILFGLAGAGRQLAQGTPWPLALLIATLEGSILGLFYGLLRDRTGSLGLPVYLHAYVEMWIVLPQAMQWLAAR